MRYEDSSQAGAFSGQSEGQGPEARDDMDTVPAGTRGPVTGNVISGEGTQFGAASSDLSAADANVTAIAGQGGQDSSFSGGKLSVTGEYGKLSIDAEGNYSYLANQGAPENSRDRFTYTLADKQGNSDTAALTIEIGKTPTVVQANAQQVVVGPDGVVVLPAGVQLSDISVVGRNLVVTLPDGSQMVIIDGAVFVPQLVLGTVEVPATNLAALLIDSEPRPAAGTPPPSGGGNFGLPPGPLDPGVPLGDLLPPTEMVYTPPDVREVRGILDRKPEIFVDPGDGVPVENAVDSVNEAGLPARNEGEPQGSGEEAAAGANGDPSETTTGTIVYNSPDDPNTITIDGLGLGGPVVITAVGQVIQGQFGVLTITSIAEGAIGYSYTLADNTSGNNTSDPFTVVITDNDGDTDTATLTINIVDDVPTARPDTDSIAAGQFGPATGNVITDAAAGDVGDSDNGADTVGADNATITAVSSVNVPANLDTNPGANFLIAGQYGVLTLNTNGSYSYTRNEGTPGGVTDVFNYTLTDGDGDTSTTTLTISIADATPQTGENPTARLDDDALANGNPGGVDDDVDAANLSGNLAASGGDGPLTFDLLLTGAPAGFTYVDGPAGAVHVMQGATHVLTITVNSATGAYTVAQINPIDHPAGNDENNVQFTINYRVTDLDGDPADGTLNINVDDDTPEMNRADVSLPTLLVDESNLALNDSDDFSVIFDGDFGADGPGTTSYAVVTVNGTNSGLVDVATGLPVLLYNIGGVVTGSTSASLAGVNAGNTVFTVSVNSGTGVVTLDQLRAVEHPDATNHDDPVSPNATSIQLTATITDGDGDSDSLSANIGASLVLEDDGPTVDVTLSAQAEPTLVTQDSETDGNPTSQDSASASFAANFNVNANGGADGIDSQSVSYALGVSAPGVDSGLDQGGNPIFLHLIGGVVVGSTSASAAGVNAGNTVFNVSVDAGGTVTLTQFSQIDHPAGGDPSPTGSPFVDHVASLTDSLVTLTATATVTDGDGDTASDSQLLNIGAQLRFQDDGPDISAVLTGAQIRIDETDGVVAAGGEVDPVGGNLGTVTVAAASLFTVSNVNVSADTPTTLGYGLVLSSQGVGSGLLLSTTNAPIFLYDIAGVIHGSTSATLAGVNAGNTAFTVSVNSGTGAVTLTQFFAVEHSNPANHDEDSSGLNAGALSVQVTATDFDGDTDQASVDLGSVIRFEDDGPTIDVSIDGEANEPVLLTQDTETDGTPTTQDSASSAINFGGVFNLGFTTGSDGAATPTLSYALGLTSSVSGLTQGGVAINLYLIGGVVVGSTSATLAGVNAGNTVFDVTVSATGVVTQTQYSQIDHPVGGDPTPTGTPFADHTVGLPDGAVTLTASSTITDNDGDQATDSATVNIGANLRFADDGPDVAAALTGTLLKLDETDGVGVPGEVDPAGGNLGTITVNAAVLVNVTQPNVSADTPTTLAYSLALSAPGVASGLLLSSNNASILLFQVGNTIEGRTVNAAGPLAFTISINPATGAVTMTQFLAVEHPTPGASHDEDSSGLAAGALSLRVTATDFDGDTDQASVDLGSVIRFEDDGPSATNDTDLIVGGVGPATGNVLTGVEVGVPEDGNATDGNADNVGSDTPGSITFIDHSNVAPGAVVPGGGSVAIAGDFGVLTIHSNGDYSYLRNPLTPGGVQDVFTYTLTDADGDTVTATLTIGIDDNFPTAGNVNVQIDDDDVAGAGGNALGPNDDAPSNVSGNLPGSGGDGALTWDLLLTGAPAGFSYVDGPAGAVHVLQGATHVVTITINAATGAYTVTQVAPIVHPTLNTLAGDDTENNISFTVNYTVTDADLDVANGTINVNVDDDTPTVDVTLSTAGEPNLITQDAETDGVPTASDTASASFAANFNVAASDGADGPASPVVSYALGVSAPGVDSGLDSSGASIFLHLIGGVVVGSTSASAAGVNAGNTVFNVTVDAAGLVTLTQFSQIDHPLAGDPTPSGTPFVDHVASLTDSLVTLTATATITDTDGDTATDSQLLNIGAQLRFQDDGPDISAVLTGTQIRIDETDGVVAAGGEVDPVGGNLGTVTVAAATLFTVSHVNLSADTPTTLSYALTLSSQGVASGLLQSASNQPIFLYNISGTIHGSTSATLAGVNAGNTAFTASIDAGTGAVTLTQFQAVEHPTPGASHDEDSSGLAAGVLNVQITATDFDGDTDQASVDLGSVIRFEDDGPDVAAVLTGTLLKLDETDGVGVPGEVDPVGGNLGTITVTAASLFTVSQPHVSSDTPQTLGYSLVLSADGVASGLLLSTTNAPIFLYNIAGVVTGSTSATLAGVNAGNTAFTVSINPGTGAVTMTQFLAVEHPNPANHDEDSSAIAAGALSAVVTATDADGDTDTASVDLGSIIRFEDDGPTIDVSVNGGVTEPVLTTQDTETDGTPTTQDSASSAANFGGVFNLAFTAGSDGAATPTLSYALGVSAPAVDSGLDQGGATIFLHLIGGVVVGSTAALVGNVNAGNTVFDVTVSGTGVVTLTQYSQIDHPPGGDPTPGGSPFADHIISMTDNLITLTASSTITDNDGDTATDSAVVNIGANLRFVDDGPDVAAVLTGTLLKLDETNGVGVPGEVDPVGGNLGTITVAAATLVTISNPNISPDVPTTNSYSLVLSVDGVASGLLVSSNNAPIFLYNIAGVVTGSTSATLAGVNAGNTAFTVSVNTGTGAVTMTQFLAVEHSNTASNDEDSLGLAAGALSLRVTATDFDGDTDQASVDLGSVIRFEDDGPTLGVIENGTASNNPADLTSSGELNFLVGSDFPAVVTAISATNTGITSGGFNLVTNVSGNVLTAYQDSNSNGIYNVGVDTVAVYTLTVNPAAGADGEWVFDLITPLDPTVTTVPIGGSSSFGAGPTLGQIQEDAGGADLAVLSGYLTTAGFTFAAWSAGGGVSAATVDPAGVNGSTAGWGVLNNNFNDTNELMIFDFGDEALTDWDGAEAFTPPATALPQISVATFEFINYSSGAGNAGDDIAFVVHYVTAAGVAAGSVTGFIPAANIDGALWTHTAPAGLFIADVQFFSGIEPDGTTVQDLPSGKVDLVSVGVQDSNLDETISFSVTMTDADGDPVTGGFTVNVADGNVPSVAALSFGRESADDFSSMAFSSSNDNQKWNGNGNDKNFGNTGIVAGIVAASGLSVMPAAAETIDFAQFDLSAVSLNQGFSQQMVERFAVDNIDGANLALTNELREPAFDLNDLGSSSRGFDDFASTSLSLTDLPIGNIGQDLGTALAIEQGPSFDFAANAAFAPAIGMPAAEQLVAAGLTGIGIQQGGSVEKILADALGAGAANTVDALLQSLPGQEFGGSAGFDSLATPIADYVPAWDMGMAGAFVPSADMMFKMDVAMLHHDAVQPIANG